MIPFQKWPLYEQADWTYLSSQWMKLKDATQESVLPPSTQIFQSFNSQGIEGPPSNYVKEEAMDVDMPYVSPINGTCKQSNNGWNQWCGNTVPFMSSAQSHMANYNVNSAQSHMVNHNVNSSVASGYTKNSASSGTGNVPVVSNASAYTSQSGVPVSFNGSKGVDGVKPTTLPKSKLQNESSKSLNVAKKKSVQSPKPSTTIKQGSTKDASGKKQPAWIRESLKIIERVKQAKKLERERLAQELLEQVVLPANKNYLNKDNVSHNSVSKRQNNTQASVNDASVAPKAKDETMKDSMLKVRKTLTELLMDTTKEQVSVIAKEELKRAKSSAQARQKKFAVSSLIGTPGLNIYDSEDSDSSDDESNPKNSQIVSDEELKMLIEQKQRDFVKIEAQIELENENSTKKETTNNNVTKESVVKREPDDIERNIDMKPLTASHPGSKEKSCNYSNSKPIPASTDSSLKKKEHPHQNSCQSKGDDGSKRNPTVGLNDQEVESKAIPRIHVSPSSLSSSTLSASSLSDSEATSSLSTSSSSNSSEDSSSSDSESSSRSRSTGKMRRTDRISSSRARRSPERRRSPRRKPGRPSPRDRRPRRSVSRGRYSSSYRRTRSPRVNPSRRRRPSSRFRDSRSPSRNRRRRDSSEGKSPRSRPRESTRCRRRRSDSRETSRLYGKRSRR